METRRSVKGASAHNFKSKYLKELLDFENAFLWFWGPVAASACFFLTLKSRLPIYAFIWVDIFVEDIYYSVDVNVLYKIVSFSYRNWCEIVIICKTFLQQLVNILWLYFKAPISPHLLYALRRDSDLCAGDSELTEARHEACVLAHLLKVPVLRPAQHSPTCQEVKRWAAGKSCAQQMNGKLIII